MTEEIDILVSLLKIINSYEDIEVNDYDVLSDHPLVSCARFLANQCLIYEDGQPDLDNIEILNRYGFRVFPGEKDRFGWLTGCIQLRQGIIIFG